MVADVKQELNGKGIRCRVRGACFDEVLFADDTICISQDTKVMNAMLKAIERIGHQSGMKLNKGKCEALAYGGAASITFTNKQKVQTVEQSNT